jgi:cytochrome d ubiquinol oxidase subunit I
MVGIGFSVVGLVAWYWIAAWRNRRQPLTGTFPGLWLLRALVVASPLGFVAIEAGWVVTEVGRQPWIIYQIMRTSEAVTPVPGQFVALGGFTLVYIILAGTLVWLLVRLGRQPLPELAPLPGPPLSTPSQSDEDARHALA